MVVVLSVKLAEATARLAEAEQTIVRLKHEILLLKHWRYGRQSEKSADATGSLFAALEEEAAPMVIEDVAEEEGPSAKKKGAHGRRTLPADLPVERIVVEPSPEGKVCAPCGTEKIAIGEEIRRELDYTPGTLFVREYARPVLRSV